MQIAPSCSITHPWAVPSMDAVGPSWIGQVIGLFQTGIWPWFGADQLEDLMPWGRGSFASRPSGDGGGGSGAEGASGGDGGYHEPVLLTEVVRFLDPAPGKLIFDGTLGGGGHTQALLDRGARIVAMDQDEEALEHANQRLRAFSERFCALHGNFRDFSQVLRETGVSGLDGMLIDIGVSSHQLDTPERGFSFGKEGPLDMRMDSSGPLTAADIVNTAEEEELARIFWEFGEEPQSRRMAKAIARARNRTPIVTTQQLAQVIEAACPKQGKRHPATRAFQALRIAVNDELGALHEFLEEAPRWLRPGGRLAVITFHSLEDRIVKQGFQHLSTAWLDRPEWPEPRQNPDCLLKVLTRKPVEAGPEELARNPRARSARLRVAERLL